MHVFFSLIFLLYVIVGSVLTCLFIGLAMDREFSRAQRVRHGMAAGLAGVLMIVSFAMADMLILTDDAALAAFASTSVY